MIVHVKPGVQFTRIAPGSFRILGALESLARALRLDVTITSACDGVHSGPADPHYRGQAYDVRSHDWVDARTEYMVEALQRELGDGFTVLLEAPGTPAAHLHIQVRKGTAYP